MPRLADWSLLSRNLRLAQSSWDNGRFTFRQINEILLPLDWLGIVRLLCRTVGSGSRSGVRKNDLRSERSSGSRYLIRVGKKRIPDNLRNLGAAIFAIIRRCRVEVINLVLSGLSIRDDFFLSIDNGVARLIEILDRNCKLPLDNFH